MLWKVALGIEAEILFIGFFTKKKIAAESPTTFSVGKPAEKAVTPNEKGGKTKNYKFYT